jgi:hypothetical protein
MMPAVLVGVAVAAAAWFVARPLVAGTGDARSLPSGRPTVVVAVLAVAAVCAGVLMARAVEPRASGAGPTAGAAAAALPSATPSPTSASPSATSSAEPPSAAAPAPTPLSDAQLAAVSSALTRVRAKPRDVAAHLDLARAYADAEQPQLSAVEYLAVVRLDKANPQANTALALVALGAGQPKEGKRLVDAVLAAHPRYPDALYTRGLIYLMGLRQATPGVRDLRAYLAAAPYGSHRPAVETLLAMVSDGRRP